MLDKQGVKGDLKQEIFNAVSENVKALEALFPAAVKDGQVDFETLKEELGQFEEVGPEKYGLTWSGKQNAKKIALEDSIGKTLKFVSEESVNPDTTENLYIEGDNLEVLKLLRQNYYGAIKMIYIDPPYNTGNDFVYRDKFNMDVVESDVAEGVIREDFITNKKERLQRNLKSTNRFHANWLNMVYPRLKVAKDLLSEDGIIFISIDDTEQENLKKICNEVFGENNYIDTIVWNKRIPKNDNKGIGNIHEYVLLYSKNSIEQQQFIMAKEGLDEIYAFIDNMRKKRLPIEESEKELKKFYKKKGYDRGITLYNNLDNNYRPWGKINMSWPNAETFGPRFDVLHPKTNKPTKVPDRGWRWNESTFLSQLDYDNILARHDNSYICGNIWFARDENTQPSSIKYLEDVSTMLLRSIISLKSDGGIEVEKIFDGKSYFSYPKPTSLLQILINSLNTKDGIYLDFFSGSATTAHAVMQLNAEDGGNRKFICVQIPEETEEKSEAYKAGYRTICEIGKERIRRVGNKIKKEIEEGNAKQQMEDTQRTIPDIGFKVFKIADTMIRWNYEDIQLQRAYLESAATSEVIEGQNTIGVNMMNHKDQLDFMPYATDIDVVYEILLRQRDIPLSAPVEQLAEIGKRTYLFADSFFVCLETAITTELIEKIAAISPLPIKFVFRDSAFEDDINLKDEIIRRFKALVARNTNKKQSAYTVEFI